jgi:hypothetical protein
LSNFKKENAKNGLILENFDLRKNYYLKKER